MNEKMIRDAYCRIRTIDQTIPDDVLDFMKDAAIEKLRKHDVVGRSEQLLAFLEWYDSNVCQNDCRSREDLVKDFISQ
jgi:hypothetical protein